MPVTDSSSLGLYFRKQNGAIPGFRVKAGKYARMLCYFVTKGGKDICSTNFGSDKSVNRVWRAAGQTSSCQPLCVYSICEMQPPVLMHSVFQTELTDAGCSRVVRIGKLPRKR